MGRALIFTLLALAPGLARPAAAQVPDTSLEAWCEPAQVAIGEPFTLYLDALHPSEQRIFFDQPADGDADDFGLGWVVLEGRSVRRLSIADEPGRSLTRARWRLMALEPGELGLAAVGADSVLAGAIQRLDPVAASIHVRAELAEGEDVPRPPVGLREPPAPFGSSLYRGLLALLGLFLVLSARWWWRAWRFLRRGSGARAEAGPSPLERLAAVDVGGEGVQRETFFLLSHLVREALDAECGVEAGAGAGPASLDGLTDEEWIAARRERNGIAPERLERAARLFAQCEDVKYGGREPTRWAVEEALQEARSLCAAGAAREADA